MTIFCPLSEKFYWIRQSEFPFFALTFSAISLIYHLKQVSTAFSFERSAIEVPINMNSRILLGFIAFI